MPRHEQQSQQYETSVDGAGVAAGRTSAAAERDREERGRWHDLYADCCPVPRSGREPHNLGILGSSPLRIAQLVGLKISWASG